MTTSHVEDKELPALFDRAGGFLRGRNAHSQDFHRAVGILREYHEGNGHNDRRGVMQGALEACKEDVGELLRYTHDPLFMPPSIRSRFELLFSVLNRRAMRVFRNYLGQSA